MTTTKTILSRILFFLYLVAIAFLCFMHPDKMPEVQRYIFGIRTDKVVHFLMFLPFPILMYLAYDHLTDKVWRAFLFAAVSFLLGAIVAAGTEYGQSLLPYRTMDLADFKADLLALAASGLIVLAIDIAHMKTRRNK